MKKQIFLVGAIAIFGLSAFLLSCSKNDNTEWKGCTCTDVYYDGSKNTYSVSASDAQEYGATNCNQVKGLEMASGGGDIVSVTCNNL